MDLAAADRVEPRVLMSQYTMTIDWLPLSRHPRPGGNGRRVTPIRFGCLNVVVAVRLFGQYGHALARVPAEEPYYST